MGKAWIGILLGMLMAVRAMPAQPTDDEILAEYAKAKEASWWFVMGTAPIEWSDQVEADGYIYHRLTGFETYDEYMDYLGGLFSDELIDGWNTLQFTEDSMVSRYIEVDGKAYGIDMARGADIGMGRESCTVIRESPAKYTLRVTVELLDYSIPGNMDATGEVIGYEDFDFPYEYVDGDWIFTDFPPIR